MDTFLNIIISPCISVCKTDPVTGFCYGCARTIKEKKFWKDKKTTINWKKKNLEAIIKRMSSFQLENFKESYKDKIENEILLSKKTNLKQFCSSLM